MNETHIRRAVYYIDGTFCGQKEVRSSISLRHYQEQNGHVLSLYQIGLLCPDCIAVACREGINVWVVK